MTKKLTAFLLAMIMVLGLVGCTGGTPSETAADETTDVVSVETEPSEVKIELTAELLAQYQVLRPEKAAKGESIDLTIAAAQNLKDAINNAFGVELKLSDDWYKAADGLPETAKEILVGKTNRVETTNVLAQIKAKDFAIAFENERIVITAGTDNGVTDAVNYFIENYINTTDKKIVFNEHHLEVVAYQYPMGSISIAGTPINMAGDYDYLLLKTIENGANLYFTLSYDNTQILKEYKDFSQYYSVRYEIWFEDLVETYTELNSHMGTLQTETIVGHEFLIGERTADADELEADEIAKEVIAKAIEDALAEYEEKLAKAISFAQRKGTYEENIFEENFKKKNYPLDEEGNLIPEVDDSLYTEYLELYDRYKDPAESEEDEEETKVDYNYTKYTSDDGSIVRVTYSNGTSFILNYNNFVVTTVVDGETLTIPAYGYIVK